MYQDIFEYIKKRLAENELVEIKGQYQYPFRKRSDHIYRVYVWSKRLAQQFPNINKEALYIAALFHDVGYAITTSGLEHARYSEEICRLYLTKKGFDENFVNKVCYLVVNHSNKELMLLKDTPIELILLMEADLLDETGAMSIIWDSMAEGSEKEQSFINTLFRIQRFSNKITLSNPMVTPFSKKIWEKKQNLVNEFINQLSYDLCAGNDEI